MVRFAFAFAAAASACAARASGFRATAYTPECILVQGDASDDEQAAFFADPRAEEADKACAGWQKTRKRLALHFDIEKRVREPFAEKMKSIPGAFSYWREANGMKHYAGPDGTRFCLKAGEAIHNVFVKTGKMEKGTKVDLGIAGVFTYDPDAPSPVFKVNQTGYFPRARKYAYLGAWLGKAGPLPLKAFAGRPFRVLDAKTGAVALEGALSARRDDPLYKGTTPFTGEETLEADLTPLEKEGTYRIAVDGIGKSMPFEVSADAVVEAWAHHMRGLYNKRCGIEKKPPCTQWPSPACHLDVIRGVHPPHEGHYGEYVKPADGVERTGRNGKPLKFGHFNVISASKDLCSTNEHLSIPGGYHDAADYDRRPMHLQIPRSLAMAYLLKPGNFFDGQLCIPESGNGVPDILDEAFWGVKHLLAAQQPDGGVGTWIERDGHPGGEYNAPEHEHAQYYLAIPTRESCLDYAGTAALVSRAFKSAGKDEVAKKLLDSAVRAWDWAMSHGRVVSRMKGWGEGKRVPGAEIDLVYEEPAGLRGRVTATAALNLSAATGDMKYFEPLRGRENELQEETNKGSWAWSGFTFLEFALPDAKTPDFLERYRKYFVRRRVNAANEILKQLETAYPYRTPWFPADHGYVHTMSWGNSHPLRRAELLVAAHVFTGDRKYLDGILLCNDFHNGCNPRGESLTTGMGVFYAARFLDLQSMDDGVAEYVGGMTPYRWTFGVAQDPKKLVYGVENIVAWPVWRRFANMESYSVAASEYTVWETVSPPATVLAYLLDAPRKAPERVYSRKPAARIQDVPGYWVKP